MTYLVIKDCEILITTPCFHEAKKIADEVGEVVRNHDGEIIA